ncbi:hypothetical protein CPC08DRAFT_823938 [Agrocybe pediades]|nr:hypothetical protein CPC08DRAFT_823938 [Agrocybe pediades]
MTVFGWIFLIQKLGQVEEHKNVQKIVESLYPHNYYHNHVQHNIMPTISGPFKTIARRRSPPIDSHASPVNMIVDRRAMAAEGRRSDDSGKTLVESICSPPKGEANAHHNFSFGPSNRAASSTGQRQWSLPPLLASQRAAKGTRRGLGNRRGEAARRQPFEIYITVVTECDLPDPPGPFW